MVGMIDFVWYLFEHPAELTDAENGLTHVFKQLIYQMPGQVEDIQKYLDDQYIAAHSPNL